MKINKLINSFLYTQFIELKMAASIECVCVVGAGLMGAGIASVILAKLHSKNLPNFKVCAFHGYQVVVVDLDEKALANGKQRVQFGLDKMAEKRGNREKVCLEENGLK